MHKKGNRQKVGNSDPINFWWDNWTDKANLVELLEKDNPIFINPHCKLSKFITNNRVSDVYILRMIINKEELVQMMIGISLP